MVILFHINISYGRLLQSPWPPVAVVNGRDPAVRLGGMSEAKAYAGDDIMFI